MCGGELRINGDSLLVGLYGFFDLALSGKLFGPEAVLGGLAPLARPLGLLRLPTAFSLVHPKPFPRVWEIGRDHND